MLVVHSRQGFGIVPGMARGKDADQIPHLAEKFQRHCILSNTHEECMEADVRHLEPSHLRIVQDLFPGFDQLIPQILDFPGKRLKPLEVLSRQCAFGYL